MVIDTTGVIRSINLVDEEMIAVSYSFEDDFVEMMSKTNVVIASYTTAQARLKLHSYIERLQFAVTGKLVVASLYVPGC